jgi:hypothetical protein
MKPMTEVMVLRTVPVSDDGVAIRMIVEGTTDSVPSDLFPGLKAEGYVAAVGGASVEIEIPGNWQSLHHLQIIAIAKKLDDKVSTKAEAIAVITAELAKG